MADETKKVGSVVYREAGSEYFEKRGLRRHAGVWSLWALGVAAVISGDFSGWNLGIPAGGWGGLVVATVVITIMYIGLCYSIAEMSPAMPHTGGAYSFGRSAMGPWGGFITGLAENMEYVVTPAVVVFFAGSYAQPVFDELIGVNIPQPWWWLIFYIIFVGLNIIGIEATMRFSVVICLMSLAVLAIFFIGAIPKFDSKLLSDVGDGSFLPFGIEGVFKNLPYAIWFYLAIEELPLAAEESMDPKRDVPRGTLLGLLTLVIAAVGVLFLNPGIAPGAAEIGGGDASGAPLLAGFETIFGTGAKLAALFGLFALAGLVASFHTIIFAYGRNIFSLSRAGYFPHWMSVTHGERKTPYVALVLGGVVGWVLAFVMYQASKEGGSTVGAALLNMAVFGAVISYFMQCLSFVMLRRKMPNIARPYRSPIGEWGAVIAGIIALGALISLYLDEAYRPGVYGVAIWFVLGIVYFAIIGRNRLVLSPEEEFALTQGERGHPEDEGYGKTHIADVQT
ncbi:MAG TPA: ethanolamine permease [Actinomycetota bacterium]|nr:ethanolamine permease [Actinomycetota bacterium]